MNIFDIMGPVMVGPSLSHTAGAVRMGLVGRKLLGFQPARANIALHSSFSAAGAGCGTGRAIVAGLLAMKPDDPDIPRSIQLAKEARLEVHVQTADLRDAPPNTAVMTLIGDRGRTVVVNASSLEDGRIRVNSIDGMDTTFTADVPTLIVRNWDKPGIVSGVGACLSRHEVSIAGMQLFRNRLDDVSVMVLECDHPVSPETVEDIMILPGVVRCIYLNFAEEG